MIDNEKPNLKRTKAVALSLVALSVSIFLVLVIPMFMDIREDRKAEEEAKLAEANRPVVYPIVRIRVPAGEKKTIYHPYPFPKAPCYKSNVVDKNKINVLSREHLIEVTNRTNKVFQTELQYFEKFERLDCRRTWKMLVDQGEVKD